jgi:UDP-glucose 4-epimerase
MTGDFNNFKSVLAYVSLNLISNFKGSSQKLFVRENVTFMNLLQVMRNYFSDKKVLVISSSCVVYSAVYFMPLLGT